MSKRETPSPAWLTIITALTATTAAAADIYGLVAIHWWMTAATAALGCIVAFVTTLMQENDAPGQGWARVVFYRLTVAVTIGAWLSVAVENLLTPLWAVAAAVSFAALAMVGHFARPPLPGTPRTETVPADRRHPVIREWEHRVRTVTRLSVTVTGYEPWDNPQDGIRVFTALPVQAGTTVTEFATYADRIAAAARLDQGCAIRILESARQGEAVLDVMLRNTLTDTVQPHREPATPASINGAFPVLTTPRGETLSICLRILSTTIGGTTGSGKTTLLHRIIMWLARCTDSLVWIVDLNGGGIAEPWIGPWANGRTSHPVVDWVADSEEEAALMVAVAGAIAKDRKTNMEATRRKRSADAGVLPVDAGMPAIVLLTDEGAEVRQAVSKLGQLAAQGITRLAEIGRAEAVRVIMSVPRGTSDKMDKGLRVVSGNRICLRMEEHDEYAHVLGCDPGKVQLSSAVGAGFIKTPDTPRPVLGRTVNVLLSDIDAHAVACGHLRPQLDQWALAAATAVTPRTVLGASRDASDFMNLRIMKDASAGLAYTGRWNRYAAKLAAMRGETWHEQDHDELDASPEPGPVTVPIAIQALAAGVASEQTARIYHFPHQQPSSPATARQQLLAHLHEAGTHGCSAAELERSVDVARSRLYSLLTELNQAGRITKNAAGRYVAAAHETDGARVI